MKRKILSALLFAGLCSIAFQAAAAAETATDTVRKMLDRVMAIQNDPGLQGPEKRAERKTEIKKVIVENFNFDEMSRQALGQYYGRLDKAKQGEFRSVFQDLFLDSYSRLVLDFLKKEKITYKGEEGPNRTTVKTVIERANDQIPVDYFLLQTKDRYQVRDVSVDGVSIVGNYRDSFSRVIKRESYDSLLKRMKLQQKAESKE